MPVPSSIYCKQAKKIQENQVELLLKYAPIQAIHLEEEAQLLTIQMRYVRFLWYYSLCGIIHLF